MKRLSIEGQLELQALLFVPKYAPLNMFNNNIKLYVNHIFIIDNCGDLIHDYLSFICRVVNTEDMTCNIMHEMCAARSDPEGDP